MSDPIIAAFVVVSVLAYVAAIIWTGAERLATPDLGASMVNSNDKTSAKHAGQLYLYENADRGANRMKGYISVWSPTQHIWPLFSDYETYASRFPHPREGKEAAVTLHLLNAGPGDIRHVTVNWELAVASMEKQIRDSAVFEGYVHDITDNRIRLISDAGAADYPMLTEQSHRLPIVKEGEIIPISPPVAFTAAFAIYMLTEAKAVIAAKPTPSAVNLISALESFNFGKVLEELSLEFSYEAIDGSIHHQRFSIGGLIRGNLNVISEQPNSEGAYEIDPLGISAWFDNVRVIPNA